MTLQQYQTTLFNQSETLTLYVAGFRAKLSRLLANDKGLKTHEAHSFFKLHGSPLFSNLDIYSLKTSKDYYTTTEGLRSGQSSKRWKNWGTTSNGKCLTANISGYHNTANECSLSDILEEQVGEKYFLSETVTKKLISYQAKEIQPIHSSQGTPLVNPDRLLLKINKRA